MPATMHDLHAAAVVLNNTSVSLLERHCYSQAVETIKDGLAIMKILTSAVDEGRNGPQLLGKEHDRVATSQWPNVHDMLRRSSHSIICLQPDGDAISQLRMKLQVITLDESDAVIGAALQQDRCVDSHHRKNNIVVPTSSTMFLVRIESLETTAECLTSRVLDIELSIMLYNFGIAFKCMASTTSDSSYGYALQLYNSAYNLLELSYSIVRRDLSLMPLQQADGYVWVGEYLPLTILCLWSLADLALILVRESDAQAYSLHFNEAREAFIELLAKASHRITAPAA